MLLDAANDQPASGTRSTAIGSLKSFGLYWHRGVSTGVLFTRLSEGITQQRELILEALQDLGMVANATALRGECVISITESESIKKMTQLCDQMGWKIDGQSEPRSLIDAAERTGSVPRR